MVVSENKDDATAICQHFVKQVGPKANNAQVQHGNGGFTDFIVNREGDEFFKS
jgi:hypothetical protein